MTTGGTLPTQSDFQYGRRGFGRALNTNLDILANGNPAHRLRCEYMVGLFLHLLGEYRKALTWYEAAAEEAEGCILGIIRRAMAESYRRLGEYEAAMALITESLCLIPSEVSPLDHAISLSYLARLFASMGRLEDALQVFGDADFELNGTERLEHKLCHASAQFRAGHYDDAIRLTGHAVAIIPRYGGRSHRVRAVALLIGGWRAEAALRYLRERAELLGKRLRRVLPRRLFE